MDSAIQGARRNRAPSPVRPMTTAPPVVTSASSVRAKSSAAPPVPDSGSAYRTTRSALSWNSTTAAPSTSPANSSRGGSTGGTVPGTRRGGDPHRTRGLRPGPQRPAEQLRIARTPAPGRPGGEVDARGVRPLLGRRPQQLRRVEHRSQGTRRTPVRARRPRALLDGDRKAARQYAQRRRDRRRAHPLPAPQQVARARLDRARVELAGAEHRPRPVPVRAPQSGRPPYRVGRVVHRRPREQIATPPMRRSPSSTCRVRNAGPGRPVDPGQRPVQRQFVDAARPGEVPQPPHHRHVSDAAPPVPEAVRATSRAAARTPAPSAAPAAASIRTPGGTGVGYAVPLSVPVASPVGSRSGGTGRCTRAVGRTAADSRQRALHHGVAASTGGDGRAPAAAPRRRGAPGGGSAPRGRPRPAARRCGRGYVGPLLWWDASA
ncbi:hypothetical protein SCALM49S_09858 [Streptomyces californicus]